jgi:HlyD family secretion protein
VAQVDESDIAKISIGQEVQINTNSFPGRKWKGSVARVAAKGTPQNSAVQFEVRIALAAAATIGLRPEMTATVVVTTATARDAVLVPVAAVTWCKDKAYVTMQADGKEVEITPGANNGEKLQVLEGVAAGAVLSLPTKSGGSRWRRDTIFQ